MTHHAYLVVGGQQSARERALALFDVDPQKQRGSADLHLLSYETFGIDDARRIEALAQQRPVELATQLFIIDFADITRETQNALLKLFEEPPRSSRFAVIVDKEDRIMPTLRSRFEILRLMPEVSKDAAKDAAAFAAMTYGERLAHITALLKREDERALGLFLDALEVRIAKEGKPDALAAELLLRTYRGRRGASQKMLLEHLALSF